MGENTDFDLDNIQSILRAVTRYLDRATQAITHISSNNPFRQIEDTIEKIDKPSKPQAPARSEKYIKQWGQYKRGEINIIDTSALKYLCWQNDIVEDAAFEKYLTKSVENLSARSIKGLLLTVHQNWTRESPNAPIVLYLKEQLSEFLGRDRTISKWKSGIVMLLGQNGAALFAKNILITSLMSPKDAAEQWTLNEGSGYMRYAVVNAFAQTLDSMGKEDNITNYVFNILFDWPVWGTNPSGFRFMVKELILHPRIDSIRDLLKVKILNNKMLGDPRLPINRNKWSDIDLSARKKFISWLSKADIKFFFDIVLKKRDPHGRRDFWLRYVDRMEASRPLLNEATAISIRDNKDVNYGRLSAGVNKAAFILDFGQLVAVEFSDVGRVYIYTRSEFEQRIPNMWITKPIREEKLKDQSLPDGRMIRHVNWEDKVISIFSRAGIRP